MIEAIIIIIIITTLAAMATAATNTTILGIKEGGGAGEILLTSEYIIPLFLTMLFVAAFFYSKTKIPHSIILLIFGLGISFLSLVGLDIVNIKQFRIAPNLIIDFIIPPLIFEAMMRVEYKEFKIIRASTLLLATVGVVLATLVGGFFLQYIAGLPFIVAFVFAALISPTDAAIVIEIFKRLKVPKTLSTLIESESSFNDATGIIVFSSIVALATVGSSSSSQIFAASNHNVALSNSTPDNFKLPETPINLNIIGVQIEHFAILFFGGAAIGLAIAAGAHRLHTLMNEPLSETSLTVATVFGSIVLANSLGMSGLVAVAVAGLYFGNVTVKKEATMSKAVRTFAFNFWEMTAFFASSAAFLYLGINMNLLDIGKNISIIALAFIAVLVARAIAVYPILRLTTSRLIREKIPLTWMNTVMLGGMRGAISVALVASLPQNDFKNILQTMTFGVVLLSLFMQYIALSKYVKKVFLPPQPEPPRSKR